MSNHVAPLSTVGRSAQSQRMDTLITMKELGRLLGLSRSSISVLIKNPDFPKPYSLSARCLRWERFEVEAWLLSRKGITPAPRVKQQKASNVLTVNGIDFLGA